MRKVEVCTYDMMTGCNVVDHVWRVTKRHGARKLSKTLQHARKWANQAARFDHDSDHVVYTRVA